MEDFKDKNILVVGSSSGIGYELASRLVNRGANVISASRQKPQQLEVKHIKLDVLNMNGDEFDNLPDELHGLVYCPGSINLKPFQRLKKEDFLDDIKINLLGAVDVIHGCMKNLKKSRNASVVMFSTVAVTTGMNFHASIGAAKGAVEGLARNLAAEFAMSNIRVNIVAPSLTDTPLADNLLSNDEKREASAKRHPIKRVGTPQDMAAAATFLLSEESSWVTGQTIGVDGGMSALRSL